MDPKSEQSPSSSHTNPASACPRLERLGPAHPESRRALELAAAVHENAGHPGEAAAYRARLP